MTRKLYAMQPGVIINDRCALPMDFATPEQQVPDKDIPARPWETCMTMNGSWGYKAADQKWKSAQVLIRTLADVASKGGNFLLNVGPDGTGVIPAPSVERLQAVGKWMEVNGESIYGTTASPFPKPPFWGRYTLRQDAKGRATLYVHVFLWPTDGQLEIPGLTAMPKRARILGVTERPSLPPAVGLTLFRGGLGLTLPGKAADTADTVIALEFDSPLPLKPEPPAAAAPPPVSR
jgi:alpha-L-fucosidase